MYFSIERNLTRHKFHCATIDKFQLISKSTDDTNKNQSHLSFFKQSNFHKQLIRFCFPQHIFFVNLINFSYCRS